VRHGLRIINPRRVGARTPIGARRRDAARHDNFGYSVYEDRLNVRVIDPAGLRL
jgi:hypothetical protein